MFNDRINEMKWPSDCSIQCFISNGDLKVEKFLQIYSCSPHLHRLIVKQKLSDFTRDYLGTFSFPQLTSVSFEQVDVTIDRFEAFLLRTHSLTYLKFL